jgi:hypothetical protein
VVADILAIKDARPIFIEVKREGGKQSPEQKEFEDDVRSADAAYHVVRSIDDVQAIGL